jgi:hypothetical protein
MYGLLWLFRRHCRVLPVPSHCLRAAARRKRNDFRVRKSPVFDLHPKWGPKVQQVAILLHQEATTDKVRRARA